MRAIGIVLAGVALGFVLPAEGRAQAGTTAPAVRFHEQSEELLQTAYPTRYAPGGRELADDIAWVRDHDGELRRWWRDQGPLFLLRAADMAGLEWPYHDIEVYLTRYWPVISIEHPLVLALDEVQGGQRSVAVPEDRDVRVLLLAHQLVHYLLDDPEFVPERERDPAYSHPFLAPGNFEVEAMVNWVTYTALEDLWGRERVERAAGDELWRAYNPNHDYVVDELMARRRLSRTRTLRQWLADNPPGSEIFRVRDDYARRAGETAPPEAAAGRETLTGTEYGIDLGASYDGPVFVAYVDEGSPAARAGVLQGDVVRTIEGRDVGTDVSEARRRLDESWDDNREINLSVVRDGREVWITVQGRR